MSDNEDSSGKSRNSTNLMTTGSRGNFTINASCTRNSVIANAVISLGNQCTPCPIISSFVTLIFDSTVSHATPFHSQHDVSSRQLWNMGSVGSFSGLMGMDHNKVQSS